MRVLEKRSVAALLAIYAATSLATGSFAAAPPANEIFTNAADILALAPDHAAQKIAVSITGVVTVAEPNWRGRYFVQDASGGVFINNTNSKPPSPGDLVEVTGETMPGGYAPCIDN